MRTLVILAAMLLASTAAHANSPQLQAIAIPASACQLELAPFAKPQLSFGSWSLPGNGRALFLCPVPVAGRDGVILDRLRLIYRDPDGRTGNASVKVFLLLTTLTTPTGPLNTTFAGCDFLSNFNGTAVTTWNAADFACPSVAIPPGSRTEIVVELWRRGAGDASFAPGFAGFDFP